MGIELSTLDPDKSSMTRADDIDEYRRWAAAYGTPDRSAMARMHAALSSMPFQPLITVVLVGSHAPTDRDRSVNSLKAQLYPAWQIATDYIDGAFTTVLSAGDQLAPHALFEAVRLICHEPDAEIIYADCDEIDAEGLRSAPDLKPGWDPDLLLGYHYLDGFTLYRSSVFLAAGEFRDDSYALALRAAAATLPARIHHIPMILCHRAHRPSGSQSRSTVERHLGATHRVEAAALFPQRNRVFWPLPDPAPLVSVIVPTRDAGERLARCIEGLLEHTHYPKLDLLIADNETSDDLSLDVLDQLGRKPNVGVLRVAGPFNYSAINNRAAAETRGDIILLLNDDVEVLEPDWLTELVSHAVRPDVGAVGAKLLYPDGKLQHGGVMFAKGGIPRHVLQFTDGDSPGWNGQLALTRTLSAVTGACLALRRSVFDEVGGFDADAFPTSYSDVDLCLSITERGYRVVWTPFAVLRHLESASRGQPRTAFEKLLEDRALDKLRRRWRGEMDTDPFQNPCLQLQTTTAALLLPRE